MAGGFELYRDEDRCTRFRLIAEDGSVMLTSEAYVHEDAAIAGIRAVQEIAVAGRIVDRTGLNVIEANQPAVSRSL